MFPDENAAPYGADIADGEGITSEWMYYGYIGLTMVPVYLFFKLWIWMGWELYVNN